MAFDLEESRKKHNKKSLETARTKFQSNETVPKLHRVWMANLADCGYRHGMSFSSKELGMAKSLIKTFQGGSVPVLEFVEFAIHNWESLRAKITWGQGKKSRLGEYPTFTELFYTRVDILNSMEDINQKEITADKEADEFITITRPEDMPEDYPEREMWLARLEAFGKIEIHKEP